jgi:hypothetical protein
MPGLMTETAQTVSSEGQTQTIPEEPKPRKLGASTIWCDLEILAEFRKAVKLAGVRSLTEEWNGIMSRRLAEIRGTGPLDPNSPNAQAERLQQYESIKAQAYALHGEQLRMVKFLKDQRHGIWSYLLTAFAQATGNIEKHLSDDDCWRIITHSMNDDKGFKRAVSTFLIAHKDFSYAYDFVHLLEKVKERLRLQGAMLQFQADQLGKAEFVTLEDTQRVKEEEERKRVEAQRLQEEERERQRREEEEKGLERDDNEWGEDDNEEDEGEGDAEEEDEEDYPVKPPLAPVPIEEKPKEECRAIVLVGGE